MKFKATVNLAGKTATGIEIPPAVIEALDAGKKPPVKVTLNGYTYRSTVASRGDRYLVGINADVRAAAGVVAGDELEVDIELDTEPRKVEVPAELAKALSKKARARFDALSNSKKKTYTLPIAAAKTDATREKHIARAVSELSD